MSLKLQQVTKRFGDFTAVDELSLEIPPSEMFGFLGSEWSGKDDDLSNGVRIVGCNRRQDHVGR